MEIARITPAEYQTAAAYGINSSEVVCYREIAQQSGLEFADVCALGIRGAVRIIEQRKRQSRTPLRRRLALRRSAPEPQAQSEPTRPRHWHVPTRT
jgi:hypothetical protein